MVHSKFKIFQGSIKAGKLSKNLIAEMKKFSDQEKVDCKSIGICSPGESNGEDVAVIVSLGYLEKKSKNKKSIDFKSKKIGNISEGLEKLEVKIEKAAIQIDNTVCHELLIDNNNDMHAIFMVWNN